MKLDSTYIFSLCNDSNNLTLNSPRPSSANQSSSYAPFSDFEFDEDAPIINFQGIPMEINLESYDLEDLLREVVGMPDGLVEANSTPQIEEILEVNLS